MNENNWLSGWEPVRISQIMWECEWLNENVCDWVRYWWIMVSLLLRSRNQPAGFTPSCTIMTLVVVEFSVQCTLFITECAEFRIKCTRVHKDPDHFTPWATPNLGTVNGPTILGKDTNIKKLLCDLFHVVPQSPHFLPAWIKKNSIWVLARNIDKFYIVSEAVKKT